MKTSFVKRLTIIALLAAMFLTVAACGQKAPSAAPTAAPAQASAETTEGPYDPFSKFDPEINVTAWRYLQNGIQFEEGDTIDNNTWIDYYKEEWGINLSYVWAVPEDQWKQRMNIAVASGDLPDLMVLDNKNLIDLAENDLLYDLTDVYDEKLDDFTKSILEQDITSFNTAKVGEKLYAIPHTGSAIDQLQFLFVRTDWLENLNMQPPTTMQELFAVIEAFTKNDPNKSGEDDTYGLAILKSFIKDGHFGATGFFAGYDAYVRRWIEDANGDLAYGSIQPEVKTGLIELQRMFKEGMIDPEFGVKDRAKVNESIGAGKIGVTYGTMSSPMGILKDCILNDLNADWAPLPIVSATPGKTAEPITKMPVTRYYAANKNFKYPETLMKMAIAACMGYDPEHKDDGKWVLGVNEDGISVWHYQFVGAEPAKKNLNAHYAVLDAIEKNDTSKLNLEIQGYYDKIMQFRNGESREFWTNERVFGTPSTFDVMHDYVTSGKYKYDKFYGSLTPTMVEKMATLEAMEDEIFTKIIMGEDISLFDKFVQDWMQLGGDLITEEVNEWYGPRK